VTLRRRLLGCDAATQASGASKERAFIVKDFLHSLRSRRGRVGRVTEQGGRDEEKKRGNEEGKREKEKGRERAEEIDMKRRIRERK
jgi:hypothetical protein